MENGQEKEFNVEIKDSWGDDIRGYYAHSFVVNKRVSGRLFISPFGNCQIFTIAHFYALISLISRNPKQIYSLVRAIMDKCNMSKTLLQVDIEQNYFNMIKDHCVIYSANEYKNLTGSKMVSVMIDVRRTSNGDTSTEERPF